MNAMERQTLSARSRLSLSFSASGFLVLYQIGAVKALLDLAPEILKSAPKVYGASAGSLVAAAVVFRINLGKKCSFFFHFALLTFIDVAFATFTRLLDFILIKLLFNPCNFLNFLLIYVSLLPFTYLFMWTRRTCICAALCVKHKSDSRISLKWVRPSKIVV